MRSHHHVLAGPVGAVLGLCVLSSAPAAAAGPEPTVREFVTAMALHDTQAFARVIRPHPRASDFINPQPLTADERAVAERRLANLQLRQHEVLHRGVPVDADAQGDYPVGSVARVIASSNGGPAVVTVVRESDRWKVDLRWWVAMLDMSRASAPPPGSPDHTIRHLMLALMALNRKEAMRFVVPDADVELVFAGAPRYREPSGVLEASAMEMPLVEVGPGEFYRCPSGRVVEGSAAADRKVMVGHFGPVEITFVLRRVAAAWRVEAEPYFVAINQ